MTELLPKKKQSRTTEATEYNIRIME